MTDSAYDIFSMRVTDRFGDYGIIAVAIVYKKAKVWHIEQLLMSCRILGRGAEFALVGTISLLAARAGAEELTLSYVRTEKNIPAKTFINEILKFGPNINVKTHPIDVPSWFTVRTHI